MIIRNLKSIKDKVMSDKSEVAQVSVQSNEAEKKSNVGYLLKTVAGAIAAGYLLRKWYKSTQEPREKEWQDIELHYQDLSKYQKVR